MASETSNNAAPSPKQLVFFFMAATVVAVVVFLCGVLVGRGVPLRPTADSGGSARGNVASSGDGLEPAALDPVRREPSAAASGDDELTYYRRLEADDSASEPLTGEARPLAGGVPGRASDLPAVSVPSPAEDFPAPPVEAVERLERVANAPDELLPPPAPASPPASSPTPAPADGYAYTVQVAALRAPEAAEQVAGRLIAKGFPAFVLEPAADAPVPVYRVRVGQYRDHNEAERIRRRLEVEEQFKPWITR